MPRGLEPLDWLGLGARFAAAGLRRTAHEFHAAGRTAMAELNTCPLSPPVTDPRPRG